MKIPIIDVLLIEDDAGHARLVTAALSRAEGRFHVQWAANLADTLIQLGTRGFDAAVVDLALPDSRGIETVVAIHRHSPNVALVVLTSLASDEAALAALDEGAQDYLVKEEITAGSAGSRLLAKSIRYAMQRQQSSTEINHLLRRLREHQGLLERKNHRLARLYETAQRVVENVSHEFRTPLTVVKEYVSLVRDGFVGSVNDEQRRLLDVAADRADDLNRLVDDMLDISKIDSGLMTLRRSANRVEQIVGHVLPSLRRKAAVKNVQLGFSADPDLHDVYCDADKVGHVLINLVVNAIKFARDPGQVQLLAVANAAAQEVLISVTDNGPGVAASDVTRMFRRFKQLRSAADQSAQGFGLGLNIVKELVSLNFGEIRVASELDRGCTFTFSLPFARPAEVARRYLNRLTRSQGGDCKISLVLAEMQEDVPEMVVGEVGDVLDYVLRSQDLLFSLGMRRWLLVLTADADGVEKFRHRMIKNMRATNRNRLGDPLPAIGLHTDSTWCIPDDAEDLLARVAALAATEVEVQA